MVPLNIGDIPDQLPPLDDYSTTVPFNTNFPGLLDHPSSSAGLHFHVVLSIKKTIIFEISIFFVWLHLF